jgi:hypothetical protein
MTPPKVGVNAPLLEEYLHQLRLPTFAQNWQSFAQDATKSGCPYDGYLMALTDFEIAHRE